MIKIQQVRCPNCGKYAQRKYFTHNKMIETACPSCDYLLVNCSLTGQVLESYAPGLSL